MIQLDCNNKDNKRLNILVTNDDGIDALGIVELVNAMKECGNVYVVAPHDQRSASSHALSLRKDIVVKEVEFEGATKAYECTGTPADCAKLGIHFLGQKGIKIDAVYSGINMGANLANDNMYSGTVSAAAEGLMLGLPSVAVSVCSHDATHFETACKLAQDVLPFAAANVGKVGVISINTPDLPAEEIKGVKIARLGTIEYDRWFEEVEGSIEEGQVTYRYTGEPLPPKDMAPDTDVVLTRAGYATISCIKYDLNDHDSMELMKNWELNI